MLIIDEKIASDLKKQGYRLRPAGAVRNEQKVLWHAEALEIYVPEERLATELREYARMLGFEPNIRLWKHSLTGELVWVWSHRGVFEGYLVD